MALFPALTLTLTQGGFSNGLASGVELGTAKEGSAMGVLLGDVAKLSRMVTFNQDYSTL